MKLYHMRVIVEIATLEVEAVKMLLSLTVGPVACGLSQVWGAHMPTVYSMQGN